MVTEAEVLASSLSAASASLLLDSKIRSQCQKQQNRQERSVRALSNPSNLVQTRIHKEGRLWTHGQASWGPLLMEDLQLGLSFLGFQHGRLQWARPEGSQNLVPLEIK